jgi:hypothetical protein
VPGKLKLFGIVRVEPEEALSLGEVSVSGPDLHLQTFWLREDFSGH